MREVFGERGNQNVQAARADKPTEVGDAARGRNPDKTQMNKGRISFRGCPRRGDRCGDRVKCALTTSFVLEKRFERTHKETPFPIEFESEWVFAVSIFRLECSKSPC